MRIFAEAELRAFLESHLRKLDQEVQREEKNKLLNVNEDDYIDYLVANYSIEPLEILWDDISVSEREERIPAELFPSDFDARPGAVYPKQVITYHIPFTTGWELLSLTPSTHISWSTDVNVSRNTITFDIINWRDSTDDIKRKAGDIIRSIRQQHGYVVPEVAQYNDNLRRHAEDVFRTRKAQLLRQSNLLESLGVPVKKAGNVPETFTIPAVKRKTIINKPKSSRAPYEAEPVLDEEIYEGILNVCHDAGVEMERHPSIYQGKDEETLRDHLLMVLAPNFESTTGETFNKQGKTDILIRHENSNVFVGECKFWGGPKLHEETIDQLLSYLTWRDSKAAIIYFVQNKNLNPVFDAIHEHTPEHACFVKDKSNSKQGRFDYRFHLPEDETRQIEVAILCFHFPKG